MTTLTVTQARKNLSGYLRRAGSGEEIAIIDGATLYAVRPVAVAAADYAFEEYGATPVEVAAAVARLRAESNADRAAGRLIPLDSIPSPHAPRRPLARRRPHAAKARA